MKKRILIVGGYNQSIPPVNGGAVENLVQMFIESNEELKELQILVASCFDEKIIIDTLDYKYTDFLFVKKIKPQSDITNYLSILLSKYLKRNVILGSRYINELIKILKKKNIIFDSVLVENYVEAILPFYRAYPDKQLYLHLHNDKLNAMTINGKQIVNVCEKIITVSEYIKGRVDTIKSANSKTVTVLNSINLERFGGIDLRTKKAELRRELGILEEHILIVFAGRIAKTKGVIELVRALKKTENNNLRLLIIGNSWYGSKVVSDKYTILLQKESRDLKDRVIFTGYIDYRDMPQYYAMADIIVIPSIWQEPCSLTLFEAMASGVALITTQTGGTPEVVQDYAKIVTVDSSFVEELAQSIRQLAEDKDLRHKMAEAAYKYVQIYNPTRYYSAITKILLG